VRHEIFIAVFHRVTPLLCFGFDCLIVRAPPTQHVGPNWATYRSRGVLPAPVTTRAVATAASPSSRQVDELLDERLMHRFGTDQNPANGGQRRPIHNAAAVEAPPGCVSTATGAARLMPDEHCARAQEMTVRAPLRWPRQVWTIQPASV
jgi:hypothetical protein